MVSLHSLSLALDHVLDRTVLPGFSALGHAVRRRLPSWPADPAPDALVGAHVAVTGATSGLGHATARQLSELGAHVHLIVRDAGKAEAVAADLVGPSSTWLCDLSDLDSVRRCAHEMIEAAPSLAGLVHNAGALPSERTESAQGHEITMALHVLGPVLLTGGVVRIADRQRLGVHATRGDEHDPRPLFGQQRLEPLGTEEQRQRMWQWVAEAAGI